MYEVFLKFFTIFVIYYVVQDRWRLSVTCWKQFQQGRVELTLILCAFVGLVTNKQELLVRDNFSKGE